MKTESIQQHFDLEAEFNFQKHQATPSLQYPSIVTDADLKPIILDQLPPKLTLLNFDKNYKTISCIGTGSFGTVKLCKKTSDNCMNYPNTMMENSALSDSENFYNNRNKLVAVKTMMTRLDNLSSYSRVRELKFIFTVPTHKNLLRVYECFIDDKSYKLHIALEVMDQNLYQLIKFRISRGSGFFSHSTLQSILSQILAGLYHIHSNGFFHRDLKPENILISTTFKYYDKAHFQKLKPRQNYVVKIADYGLSRQVNPFSKRFTAYVSTRWYRSPEILLRDKSYCKPIDIWAFGCVAFECSTFTPLFPGSNEMDQIWKILQQLGTPFLMPENAKTGYIPHGGVWDKARKLVDKLNIQFPYVEGLEISEKILPMVINSPVYQKPNSSKIFSQLCEVIKNCLTWSPVERITVENMTQLPYFQNTDIHLEHRNKIIDAKKKMLLEQQYFLNKETTSNVASPFLSSETMTQNFSFNKLTEFSKQVTSTEPHFAPERKMLLQETRESDVFNPNLPHFDLELQQPPNGDFENSFLDLYNSGITKENSELNIDPNLLQQNIARTESPLGAINVQEFNSSINYVFQKPSITESFATESSFLNPNRGFAKSKLGFQEPNRVSKHIKEKPNLNFNSNVFTGGNFILNESNKS